MRKIIILLSMVSTLNIHAQNDTSSTALLLIDIQNFYFAGGSSELVNPIPASSNAQKLLYYFRQRNMLIIHVKHGDGVGAEIYPNVKPLPSEKVIVKKEVNSFLHTDLLDYLKQNGIKTLVICGMQTHMCVEAAVRAAVDFGFNCILIQDACATKDVKFGDKVVKAEDVHYSTLATLKVYCKVLNTQDFIKK
jgi:nicotinamidase-related amidase